jgi:hypothetical protein
LIREVAYQTLGPARRRRLHLEVASAVGDAPQRAGFCRGGDSRPFRPGRFGR